MKYLVFLFLLYLPQLSSSQNTKHNPSINKIRIYGSIFDRSEQPTFIYAICPFIDGYVDSARVKDGRYYFELRTSIPTLITLYSRNPKDKNSYNDKYMLTFISEPGLVKITSKDSFYHASISGIKANKEYKNYLNQTKQFWKKISILNDEKRKSPKNVLAIENQIGEVFVNLLDFYLDYLDNHPRSYLRLFIIDDYLNVLKKNQAVGNLIRIDSVFQALPAEYKKSKYGQFLLKQLKSYAIKPGIKASDFEMTNEKGEKVSLSSLKGKYILLDFWASWCAPCRKKHPELIKLFNKFEKDNFTILSVSLDTNMDDWREAIKKDGIGLWQHVAAPDGNNLAEKQYKITHVPQNFLINPDGIIVEKNLYGDVLERKLADYLLH